MVFFACIFAAVSCICQPVMDALQNAIQTAAGDLFTRLRGRVYARIFSRPSPAEEVPVSSASVIGMEETLQEIQSYLDDETVAAIGICGMGGIGKTTLLQKVNNVFCSYATRGMFDLVIWVTISKEVSILQIQKRIGVRLGLSLSEDGQSVVEENADILFRSFSEKRFLLLLDDLWAVLDLVTIGIPIPMSRKNQKIVFTTRSLQVCSDMDADKKVCLRVLNETQSWELFSSKVRAEAILNSRTVRPLAKQVVNKCGGLPLALITVGKAMANKELPEEWNDAIWSLDHSAAELHGMDKVISALKLSYDYLENDMMRSALLFCAMYPEDEEINRADLIEYWVGEGLLDRDTDVHNDIGDARNRGHVLIRNLQSAYLLEPGLKDAQKWVRMHDAVRDMALWISSHGYGKADAFLVLAADKLTQVHKIQGGEHMKRIWMCDMDLNASTSCIPPCPNSWTLLLRRAKLGSLHLQGVFKIMRALRVLDLAWAGLEELPKEIGLLVELQYLDLFKASIKSLPKEFGNLIKLRQLDLGYTIALRRIPREAIMGLSSLQVLHMCGSGYEWGRHGKKTPLDARSDDDDVAVGGGQQLEMSDLDGLARLQELHITLPTWHEFERISSSHKLLRCIRLLHLDYRGVVDGHSSNSNYRDGDSLLQTTFNKIGAHLRRVVFNGHLPFGKELHLNLDELPCLEELRLADLSTGETTRVVLTGSINHESSGNNGGAVSPFRKLDMECYRELKELELVGRFYCLEVIDLQFCGMVQKLVLGDDDGADGRRELLNSYFPMLKKINLRCLDALESISRRPLLLPSLETIRVVSCGRLRRLPLARGSAPNLRKIYGQQEWWDALEWDNRDGGDVKTSYQPFFRAHGGPEYMPSISDLCGVM